MRMSLLFPFVCLIVLICSFQETVFAQPVNPNALSNATPTGTGETAAGVLILNDGTLMSGIVTPNVYGYQIASVSGRQLIPTEFVYCSAKSVPHAYQKLKIEKDQPTLKDHLVLAKLCLNWGYQEGAVEQTKFAIAKAPDHPDARRLADMLLRTQDPSTKRALSLYSQNNATSSGDMPRQIANYHKQLLKNNQVVEGPPPLPGLDNDQTRFYMSEVQMVLMNRCGNARCHGNASENSFRLTWISSSQGVSRKRVEENLKSVISQIDPARPELSPLLTVARREDGYHGKNIWTHAVPAKNFEAMYLFAVSMGDVNAGNNVQLVNTPAPLQKTNGTPLLSPVPGKEATTEKSEITQANATSTTMMNKPSLPAGATVTDEFGDRAIQPINFEQITGTAVPVQTPPMSSKQVEEKWNDYARSKQPDAFDPNLFNQKFGR